MSAVVTTLLDRLLADQPAEGTPAETAVRRHREHRAAWYGPVTGPLLVADTALAAWGRAAAAHPEPLDVVVVGTSGAGGLTALAGRSVAGVRVVGVESTLRDLDDLAGGAARVAAAARGLTDIEVVVGLPDAPGWVRAVAVLEAAGLRAGVRCDPDAWRLPTAAQRLAERLSVLVEADLAFAVAPGTLPAPGRALAGLAMLVEALVDGAEPGEAAELLLVEDAARLRAGFGRWDAATAGRVRRRLLSFVGDPGAVVADLVTLGLVSAPSGPDEER